MVGKTHQLFVTLQGGKYKVMMASTPAELIARIDRAASSPKANGTPGVLGKLSAARAKVLRAESLFSDAMQIGDDMKRIRDTESSMIITVAEVEAEMIDLGKAFDISELTGGKYVLDDKVHPDYQRNERRTFYGPARAYQQHVAVVRQKAINERNARYADPTKVADSFWCPGVAERNRYAHLARFSDGYAVDHVVGAATHWKNGDATLSSTPGNNSGQIDRVSWYGNIGNLQLLCKACNDSKQSLGDRYDPPVGKGFSGPNGLR
jgi:hypothetical protein